jgi:DNA processing protein
VGIEPPSTADWLHFQRSLAWFPEPAGSALREGHSPRCVLARLCPAQNFAGVKPGASVTERFAGLAGGAECDLGQRDRRILDKMGAHVLPLTNPTYPVRLAALVDAPPVLLVRGASAVLNTPAIAIIAACGLTIVSGLARGIDAEAHRGALEVGGRTVAVLACGVDGIYPPEHRALADEITIDGVVLSEMPLGTSPRRELFPLRNRIISGLSLAVIVVEARRRSGSLITVRHALNQGREVFVVPGASVGPFAQGSNQLLREGARAISTAADVLEDLGLSGLATARVESDPVKGQALTQPAGLGDPADPLEQRILKILETGPARRDELVVGAEIDPAKLARALLDLELAGRVIEERDGQFHRCWG